MASTARGISYALKYPGSTVVVGAVNFPLLQRTALKEWTDRFSIRTPWDHLRLPNRLIIKKPTQNDKSLIFANGSKVLFLHFDDPAILRGIDADLIIFEECSLLPSKESFDELTRRLSGHKGVVRQLILATNPDKLGNWLSKTFKLRQKPLPDGSYPPLIEPCDCHLCQDCLIAKKGSFNYLGADGEPYTKVGAKCSECDSAKQNDCPGKQVYYRVIKTGSMDNPHIPQDYVRTMQASMDSKTASIFIEGRTDIDIRESFIYSAFTEENNVYETEQKIDLDKPIYWSLDFNMDPQCSVICQEIEENGKFHISVIDEIVRWNSLPEHVAQVFCERYAEYKEGTNPVYIYGDPAGLWGTGDNLVMSSYEKIRQVLISNGFDVKVMMKRPDKTITDPLRKERVKIPVAERIQAVNAMLCNSGDPPEVRLKINPHCENVIMSLMGLQTTEDGKSIDKKVDKNAGRATNKNEPHLMTHPTDALGYYVFKRFPIIKGRQGVTFFQVPGDSVIEIKDGKVTSKSRSKDLPERTKKRREEREKRKLEREALRDKKKKTLKNYLDEGGWWNSWGNTLF